MKKLFLMLLFVIGGLAAGTVVHIWMRIQAPSPLDHVVVLEIPKGSGPGSIGRILQDSGLVQSGFHFRIWCRISGVGPKLRAGYYRIQPGLNIPQIAELLTKGTVKAARITIPEGRASWEIFAIYQKMLPRLDSAVWEDAVQDSVFARELGIPSPTLEGWLFPDTYELPDDASEKKLLEMMVKHALAVVQSLQEVGITQREALGGWHQVMTLASIVEEETGNPDERPHIAGVFLNRLRIGMPLGADPTVRFIYRDLRGELWKTQLNSKSPYNTRRFAGLPPGPISNPGRAAIEAVLEPMKTKDLFFVAKDDGSGHHFFAPTLEQHNKYKRIAAKNRAKG